MGWDGGVFNTNTGMVGGWWDTIYIDLVGSACISVEREETQYRIEGLPQHIYVLPLLLPLLPFTKIVFVK
jgi:hypothetical protein